MRAGPAMTGVLSLGATARSAGIVGSMLKRIARRSSIPGLLLASLGLLALEACGPGGLPPAERAIPRDLARAEREVWRRLPLDGAYNFRDLGGYASADGRTVKWGVLYRSGALGDLSDEDVSYLARLDLARVVDFRSAAEREREPDRLPPGPKVVERPIRGEGLDPRVLQDRVLSGDASGDELAELLVEGNRAFVTEFAPQYRAFLHALAEPGNLPTLFHCTAGKDRAGFAAALALMAVGVPRDAIMRDYLLTNRYSEDHTRSTLRVIRFASLFRADPASIRPLFEARESYLQAAFDTIDAKYGGTEAYLRDGLGVDDALRARLEASLLD